VGGTLEVSFLKQCPECGRMNDRREWTCVACATSLVEAPPRLPTSVRRAILAHRRTPRRQDPSRYRSGSGAIISHPGGSGDPARMWTLPLVVVAWGLLALVLALCTGLLHD
jgi:hypothetical protein